MGLRLALLSKELPFEKAETSTSYEPSLNSGF